MITIHPRTTNDLKACADVLCHVYESNGYPVEGVNKPIEWLTPPSMIKAWIARHNKAIIGHVALAEPADEDAAPKLIPGSNPAVLCRLFVDPDARHLSAGKQLTHTATSYMAEHGRDVALDVMAKDIAAIHLYETLGWQRIGTTMHHMTPAYCYVFSP